MEPRRLPPLLLLAFAAVLATGQAARRPIHHATACGEARVYITVSPRVRSGEVRQLEVAWSYGGAQPGDRLALYDYDPVERRPWRFARHGITYSVPAVNGERPELGGSGSPGAAPAPPPAGPYGGQYGPYASQVGQDSPWRLPGPPTSGPSASADPRDPSRLNGNGPAAGPPGDPYGSAYSDKGAPYSGQGAPYNGQSVPYNGQGTPYNGQGVPYSGQGAPYNGQGAPYNGQGVPYNGQGAPYIGQGAPYNGQGVPYNGQGAPYNGQGSPYNGQGSPYDGQGSPPGSQYPAPYNGWGGSATFPAGPRDAFGGRARRQDQDQDDADRPPVYVVPTDGLKSGWRPTSVQEKHVSSSQLGYKPRCLNHWLVYERPRRDGSNQTDVLAVNCLRTRPTWMWDFREEWLDKTLSEITIPGTHDSAAYRENGENSIVDRYSVTQDESILGQLIYGVRYIDLRVGYYPRSKTQWWANHGPVRVYPLLTVFHDIKAFLSYTNEIVILDVQNFPVGFGNDNTIHHKLVHLLETELGELMMPRPREPFPGDEWKVTMRDIWQGGRRLIVGYDRDDILGSSNKLWLPVNQRWGNVQTPEELSTYVSTVVEGENRHGRSVRPWAIMAQLTLNAQQLARHPTRPLRNWAHLINRNVTDWAERNWQLNVMAVDFIRDTNVVDAAIAKNLVRSGGVSQCHAHQVLNAV